MLKTALYNRLLYELGGHWACRHLVWLRGYHGPAWYKSAAVLLLRRQQEVS